MSRTPCSMLGVIDFLAAVIAAGGGVVAAPVADQWHGGSQRSTLPHLLTFAMVLQLAMVGVGAYGVDALRSMRIAAARLMVAISLGVILLSLVFFLLPAVTFWRSNLLYAMGFDAACCSRLALLFGRLLGSEAFKRRVLVLGAGAARGAARGAGQTNGAGFVDRRLRRHERGGPQSISEAIAATTSTISPLMSSGSARSEVVLALEERRNALPLKDLLRIKTTGVHVNDFSTFLERETGRVDLDSVNPSWLIFSDGFSVGPAVLERGKRLFDVFASALLLVLIAPLILLTAIAVKLESKGPAFFRQRRVGLYGQSFELLKLRSMREDAEEGGERGVGARRTIRASPASAASSASCGSTNCRRCGRC